MNMNSNKNIKLPDNFSDKVMMRVEKVALLQQKRKSLIATITISIMFPLLIFTSLFVANYLGFISISPLIQHLKDIPFIVIGALKSNILYLIIGCNIFILYTIGNLLINHKAVIR